MSTRCNGQFDLFGVGFDYPESKMRSMRFLGEGPFRVWKNRLKGGVLDVWSNKYKNDVPGVTWDFPEFKGYYRDWRWVVFSTEEGDITIVNDTPGAVPRRLPAQRRSGSRRTRS